MIKMTSTALNRMFVLFPPIPLMLCRLAQLKTKEAYRLQSASKLVEAGETYGRLLSSTLANSLSWEKSLKATLAPAALAVALDCLKEPDGKTCTDFVFKSPPAPRAVYVEVSVSPLATDCA